jgi:septum formation protein
MLRDFVYLASASPRRRELLDQLGVPYEVRAAAADEQRLPGEEPAAYVLRVAVAKADALFRQREGAAARPILAADTAVVVDGDVLGKPDGPRHALEMLERLSGRTHAVFTGVALRCGPAVDHALARSEVRFRTTTDVERRAYCATGEPLDKAGAYAIQGRGAAFIAHVAGSYSCVMGLPLFEISELLRRVGLPAWLHGERDDA